MRRGGSEPPTASGYFALLSQEDHPRWGETALPAQELRSRVMQRRPRKTTGVFLREWSCRGSAPRYGLHSRPLTVSLIDHRQWSRINSRHHPTATESIFWAFRSRAFRIFVFVLFGHLPHLHGAALPVRHEDMKRAPFDLAVLPTIHVEAGALIAIGKDALLHGEGLASEEAYQFALSSRRAPVLVDPFDARGRHHPLTLDRAVTRECLPTRLRYSSKRRPFEPHFLI